MIATMPPYYRGNPVVEATLDAGGRELQRIEDRAAFIKLGFYPQLADDTYKQLSMWELLLNLPVAQVGVSLTVRRNLILARLNGRGLSSGSAWIAAMNQAMGGTPWTYQEGPTGYTVSIYMSFSSTSFSSVQVQQLARAITPAHIDIAVIYSQGFIVGEGRVGEDRL
jgi:uncharacterized protein YmfQ (DUF2313 family)